MGSVKRVLFPHYFKDAKNKNIEIMGNTLYKAYLKDFFNFCQNLHERQEHNFRLNWASLVSRDITIGMMVLISTGFSRGFSYVTFAEIEDAKDQGSKLHRGIGFITYETTVVAPDDGADPSRPAFIRPQYGQLVS
ncbi:hypothetical protein C5167_016717 [Papaver somniferum]|nr:hypothetical protein C5167_016717 [Papaver somniferum]